MNLIKLPLNNLFIAIGFLTRLPVPAKTVYDQEYLKQSTYYFALVAWLITLLLVFIYSLLCLIFPQTICVILLIVCSVLVTGALHEDGLADFADTFGVMGSFEKKIEVMKDSKIGAFGVMALVLVIFCRFVFLNEQSNVLLALVISLCLSRLFAFWFLTSDLYIQTSKSKSKSFVSINPLAFQLILLICALPLLYLLDVKTTIYLMIGLVFLYVALKALFKRQINGINGDCMGTAQQISELSILLILI